MLGQLAEPYEVIVRFTYRASRSRAMPETEKPPAMPEDIYFNLDFHCTNKKSYTKMKGLKGE